MSWSVAQQAMLEAMGLQVMVRAPSDAPLAPRDRLRHAAVPPAPSRSPSPGPASVDHAELARALARAAGGGDLAGLIEDLDRLRREPALKRALWPRLRTLRRSH
jgi:hypothetical protein